MPTLRERFANIVLGPEKQKLERTVQRLYEAYQEGPFELPPDQLIRQLQETDSAVLQDIVTQLAWDSLGMLGGSYQIASEAARKRAVDESRRLWEYSPLAWWAIQVWTNYGLGETVKITCDDEDADAQFQECWTAQRNAELFAPDRLQDLSNYTLVDGNTFLAAFASSVDGSVTWAEIPVDEIQDIICDPQNAKRPLFYKRVFQMGQSPATMRTVTLYYPDWQAYFDAPDDLDKVELPTDAKRADKVTDENQPHTEVCILHIAHNRKNRKTLWGYPILSIATPYMRSHKRFLEDRLTIVASKAMYVRKAKVQGGSRAVATMRAKLQSNLTSSNAYETNPPAVPGATLIENGAVDTTDMPMNTGAGDAKADNEMFAWMALIGAGLFPTTAGMDTSRWATALAMDKTQAMQWSRYQTFLSSQFKKIVIITLNFAERYGNASYDTKNAQVSIDSLSLVDFPGIVESMSSLMNSGLGPLIEKGVLTPETGRKLAQVIWRIAFKALGVDDEDLTSDKTFGLADGTIPEPVKQVLQQVGDRLGQGEITPEEAAEYVVAELLDLAQ